MNNKHIGIHNSVFRVGVVYSVNGREVKIRVDHNKNSSHLIYKGTLIKNVSVGSYVKILKGYTPIIGKVESEYIDESKQEDKVLISAEDSINRILIVKLIGFIDNQIFRRGVNELPLIDNECHLLTNEEFNLIHTFAGSGKETIEVGHLANDSLVPVNLGIGKLFSSHIGIFGNTGSGKSYTLAKIYRQLFTHYSGNSAFKENAQFLFFDFNGEYSSHNSIISDSDKKVYKLNTRKDNGDKIPLADDDFLDINLLSIFSNATEKTQRPFIARSIDLYKKIDKDENKFRIFLKKQIKDILIMSDKVKSELLLDYVAEILPPKYDDDGVDIGLKTDFHYHNNSSCYFFYDSNNQFINLQDHPDQIETRSIYMHVDQFGFTESFIHNFICIMYMRMIYDVLANRALNEHIAPAIHKLRQSESDISRIFNSSKDMGDFWGDSNVVIIDLSDVNTDTKKRIPLLLTNKLYNEHKKAGKAQKYLNLIVDEAHNILSYQSTRESEEWKDYRLEVFEEIIKEGRKFGVFMTIASQRPSDISSTIISQLHNYFIHRLFYEKDIQQVNNTISYLDKVSVESLPILSTGVCVIAGQLAEMPLVVQIGKIEAGFRPANETIDIENIWKGKEAASI